MWSSRQRWSAAGLIFIGAVAGIIFASNFNLTSKSLASRPPLDLPVFETTAEAAPALASVQETGKAFTAISKAMLPAVVNIQSTIEGRASGQSDSRIPEAFRDFFRFEQPQSQPNRGLGSGVIVSKDGYILTNHHVIADAEDIKVTLYDNREFTAKLVGTDPLTEVAVIKIEGEDLPAAPLGDSEELEVGEWVLAFGSPLGLNSTVTAGIVSAKSRNINIIRDENTEESGGSWAIENFIQTDAAINRGNSGGPLVNMRGQVIGLNTAIASGNGYYVGAGFAVPINLAKRIMNDLINKGYVVRAWMGVSMSARSLTANQAEYYGMERPTGVFVQEVQEDSPAAKAGLKAEDIILKVDGKEVDASNEVQNYIALKNPDEIVTLTILRRGEKTKELRVKLGQRETGKTQDTQGNEDDFSALGLTVRDLNSTIRQRLDVYANDEGVLVTDVETYSLAFDEGVRQYDLILQIEDKPVQSVRDYRRALRGFDKGQVVVFRMKRSTGQEYQAFIKLPK